jgi:hypothetical protein
MELVRVNYTYKVLAKLMVSSRDFTNFNGILRDTVGYRRQTNILDVWHMSATRPEAHLAPPNDCLHWCQPGPLEPWQQVRGVALILGPLAETTPVTVADYHAGISQSRLLCIGILADLFHG